MRIGQLLFLAFLLIPIAEIYVLIQVGSVIGALWTVALIVLTAMLGSVLIRAQGLATLARVRASMERGEVPALELMEGLCLLVAGALLLTPGFVTDSIGFTLLITPLRRSMIVALLQRGVLRAATGGPHASTRAGADAELRQGSHSGATASPRTGHIIDGEFERKDP